MTRRVARCDRWGRMAETKTRQQKARRRGVSKCPVVHRRRKEPATLGTLEGLVRLLRSRKRAGNSAPLGEQRRAVQHRPDLRRLLVHGRLR